MQKKILVLAFYLCLLLLVGCGAPRIIDDADVVEIDYVFSFEDGTAFTGGTTTLTIGKGDTALSTSLEQIVVGKQVEDVLQGTLAASQTFADTYNAALQQKYAASYLSAMEIEPLIGALVFFPNLGTGVVIAIDSEEGVLQYSIDFNPRETYQPLQYEITVVKVEKR
jgi:FKBP-type peptidyl-prolyl cis-trans isomerase 2